MPLTNCILYSQTTNCIATLSEQHTCIFLHRCQRRCLLDRRLTASDSTITSYPTVVGGDLNAHNCDQFPLKYLHSFSRYNGINGLTDLHTDIRTDARVQPDCFMPPMPNRWRKKSTHSQIFQF